MLSGVELPTSVELAQAHLGRVLSTWHHVQFNKIHKALMLELLARNYVTMNIISVFLLIWSQVLGGAF